MDDEGDGFDFNNRASGVVFDFEKRNQLVVQRIEKAKSTSRITNIALGLPGFLPFPGAAFASLTASILAQAAIIIPGLTNDIGRIYLATPEELKEVNSKFIFPSGTQVSAIDIGSLFGIEILQPIIADLLASVGIGVATVALPVIGGAIALGIDAFVMPNLTANVGRMTSIFYQNQARWKNNSQDETYQVAKNMGDDLNGIRRSVAEVRGTLLTNVKSIIKMMIPDLSKERIREILRQRGIPDDLIDEALTAF
jgi:hypothetical protein